MMRRLMTVLVALMLIATAFPVGVRGQESAKLTFWSWRTEDKLAYDRMIKVFE